MYFPIFQSFLHGFIRRIVKLMQVGTMFEHVMGFIFSVKKVITHVYFKFLDLTKYEIIHSLQFSFFLGGSAYMRIVTVTENMLHFHQLSTKVYGFDALESCTPCGSMLMRQLQRDCQAHKRILLKVYWSNQNLVTLWSKTNKIHNNAGFMSRLANPNLFIFIL